MESLLWMLDVAAVVYLCFWALREDTKETSGSEYDVQTKVD